MTLRELIDKHLTRPISYDRSASEIEELTIDEYQVWDDQNQTEENDL